jgi:dihydroorotate dehydrogenase
MGLVERIKDGLVAHLQARGLSQIDEAVGTAVNDWL